MLIRKSKTTLQFILGAILLVTVVSSACNNNNDKKDVTKDSVSVTKMAPDTTKRDTMKTRPVVNPPSSPGQ